MATYEIKEEFENEEQQDATVPTTTDLFEIAKAILGGEMSLDAMSADELAGLSNLAGLIDADINANKTDWLGEFGESGVSALDDMLGKFSGPGKDTDDGFDPSDLPASRTGTYQDTGEDDGGDIVITSTQDLRDAQAAEDALEQAKKSTEEAADKADTTANSPIRITGTDGEGNIVVIQEGKKDDGTQMTADPNEGYAPDTFVFNPPSHDPWILEDPDHVDIELVWEGNPDDEIAIYERDRFEPIVDVATIDDQIEQTTQPPVEVMIGL